MKVRAIRVIRSAHLDACIHLAGETGNVKHKMKRFNDEIYLVHWHKDGSECVVVPEDVEVLSDDALTVMPEQSATEAASSSRREPVPVTRGMTGQEPVGTLPLFRALKAPYFCGWFHPEFDLGGEG